MIQDFFTPKLSGARFRDRTVPADILPDVAALQELLVELAKAAYMEAHPDRQRAPRNFYEHAQVHLAAIEPGSAKLKLVLFFAGLLPEYGLAFQRAQAQITRAVETVSRGQEPAMDSKFLAYFDRVGRGLREGESLDFPVGNEYVKLDQDARRALIQASKVEEYTELATLRVRVPMTDYKSDTFSVQLQDGTTIQGKLAPMIADQIAEAHNGYRLGVNDWLLLKCIVRKERSGKVKGIDSLEHASPVDPLDTSLRLAELRNLQDGWLDGNGKAPSMTGLDWLAGCFDNAFSAENPLPRLFPTSEGLISAEWIIDRQDIALEIDPEKRVGMYSQLDLDSEKETEAELDLASEAGWEQLNKFLSALSSAAEATPNG